MSFYNSGSSGRGKSFRSAFAEHAGARRPTPDPGTSRLVAGAAERTPGLQGPAQGKARDRDGAGQGWSGTCPSSGP